ncbi:hypothetical protein Tco_1508296 [Tanacetum coccineum]
MYVKNISKVVENKSLKLLFIGKPLKFKSVLDSCDEEQAQRDKQIHKTLAIIANPFKNIYKPANNNLETSLNSINKNVNTSPRTGNDSQTGQYDTDEEPDEQELEVHYMYMAKIQEVLNSDSGPTYDVEPLEKISKTEKEKEEVKKDFKEQEDKDIDKQIALENQVKILKYLEIFHMEKYQCFYNVEYGKNDLVNIFAPDSEETIRLATLKEEMLEDLKYVKSVENEVDHLKMEIDDLKSQLEHEKTDFSKVNNLLLQELFSKEFLCVILLYLDDIDEYSDMACKYLEKIAEFEHIEIELSKSHKQIHDKSFAQLEKHYKTVPVAEGIDNDIYSTVVLWYDMHVKCGKPLKGSLCNSLYQKQEEKQLVPPLLYFGSEPVTVLGSAQKSGISVSLQGIMGMYQAGVSETKTSKRMQLSHGKDVTDDESMIRILEAHYMYMAPICNEVYSRIKLTILCSGMTRMKTEDLESRTCSLIASFNSETKNVEID